MYNIHNMLDVIIIGAGVIGSLIARELKKYDLNVLLLEKNNDVGNEISGANSAIVHSGYDPKPGSLKALLNVKGNKMFDQISEELDFDFERKGSLTIAFNNDQRMTLDMLAERAKANGVEVKILSRDELIELEPKISKEAIAALYAPSAGICDPFTMVANAVENFVDNGGKLKLNEPVLEIKNNGDYLTVITDKGEYSTKLVINSAGLYSDKIAKMIDENFEYEITPRKGIYYLLARNTPVVNHVCFNVPSNLGKGVLIAQTTSNNVLVGPNNTLANSLDDVSTDATSLEDIKEKALKNLNFNPLNETIRIFAGNRPHIDNFDDFYIDFSKKTEKMINLVGIESPGLASSPAIAEYIIENFVSKVLKLEKNENFNPYVRKHIIPSKILDLKKKAEFISQNPDYGTIVCNCEQVSIGEIKDILSRSVPINSIRALKKRTRAAFGRCQGGFCIPILTKYLSIYLKKDITEVLYSENESNILKERAK